MDKTHLTTNFNTKLNKDLNNIIEYQILIKKSSLMELMKICNFFGLDDEKSLKLINDINTKIIKKESKKQNRKPFIPKNLNLSKKSKKRIYWKPKIKNFSNIRQQLNKIFIENQNITKFKNLNILYDFAIKKGLTRVEASKIINEIVGKKFKKIKSVVQGGKVNPK